MNEYENSVIVLDTLGSPTSNYLDPFFIRRRHDNLDVYHHSQSYFDLPKGNIRNIISIRFLFIQTLKDIENMYKEVGGYDTNYDEFKEICCKAWEENFIYVFRLIDPKKFDGRKFICSQSKPEISIAILRRGLFEYFRGCMQLK